jgi:DNA-binding NarL/FixJ family response regulator
LKPLRFLIIDDHEPFRQRLRGMLEKVPNWSVVAEASDGEGAVQEADQHKPDVVLIDIAMPKNGLKVLRLIREILPAQSMIIAVSNYNEEEVINECLRAGASRFLAKEELEPRSLEAIISCLTSERLNKGGKL